jgi:uncharacterized protein
MCEKQRRAGITMQGTVRAAFGLLGAALMCTPTPAPAASFDCDARGLSRTEITICEDTQLSRLDEQMARRVATFARRLNFGQYLGLRHWQAMTARQRDVCGTDRSCIGTHYRAQARFLERLQQCLETSLSRRGCLRNTLSNEREAVRR